ncbi:MAG: lysylphosphatidylglycerol synthase transmembrane domain-containing protein, partial [Desulfosarcinaceae bacterium]
GFMMNCVLPGRIGEVARPLLLKKERQVPLATGLATVATERIFDILFLIVLFLAVFSEISTQQGVAVKFGAYTLDSQTLGIIAWGMIRLSFFLLGLILLLVFPWTRSRITGTIASLTSLRILAGPGRIRGMLVKTILLVNKAIENISIGFNLVFYPGRLAACLLLTAAIWGLSLVAYMVLALGFPDMHLSAGDWTTVMVVVCFFIALPSAPGFWGLWEAGGVFALSLFGIGAKEAAGMTLVSHAVQMLPVILVGFISAAMTSVNIFRIADKQTMGRGGIGSEPHELA